jgi:hypothetical protein
MSNKPDGSDLARDGYMQLACPSCNAAGMVRWDHLQKLHVCRGCGTCFRSDASGRLETVPPPRRLRVGVRSCLSEYQDHWAPLPPESPARRAVRSLLQQELVAEVLAYVRAPRVWVPAVLVLLVGIALAVLLLRQPAPPALPRELEPRAQLFGQAYARQDVGRLVELSIPEGFLVRWLHATPPPDWLKTAEGAPPPAATVLVQESDDGKARLEIHFETPGGDLAAGGGHVLRLDWVQRDGAWLFVPPRQKGDERRSTNGD